MEVLSDLLVGGKTIFKKREIMLNIFILGYLVYSMTLPVNINPHPQYIYNLINI